ncbi:ThiF family adenylyltransferase [Mangrovibacterium diazotrophicum]|uniref:ThiF family protein n=1 Tax=Mangrovibacterium diazotrophicum TaxID=1261403 RepID=A0A419WAP4_9BACT|nr:ThiF family adenylyltransferase [Mangrovibacterium diazotrophicum]RKD92523.1 ThiF family protein [Mangrovibacterium diazotrophicum]
MSQQLINHSKDLKRLRDEGYSIEINGGHLFAHHIPYVNSNREIKYGILISTLNISGSSTIKPETHVIMFSGEYPCNKNGSSIEQIRHANNGTLLGNSVRASFSFSNKPPEGYANYYEKIKRYAEIVSAPAKSIDATVTEKPYLPVVDDEEGAVFHYIDTNSSRANIDSINQKFSNQKIGIIGMGGTGAYILDLIAKTRVQEIHIYDGDVFLNHNAFRSPGAPSIQELENSISKVDYYYRIYSNMRKAIFAHNYYVTEENFENLQNLNFVFICIDNNRARRTLINYCMTKSITIIDVGLGVNVVDDALIGQVRVTSANHQKNDHLDKYLPSGVETENDYVTNIQIAELNMLNAAQAVLKWKKLSGFYQDLEQEFHSVYSINNSFLNNEEKCDV